MEPYLGRALSKHVQSYRQLKPECIRLSEATKEAIFLQRFLKEITMHTDSLICYGNCTESDATSQTHHVDVRYHFIIKALENETLTKAVLNGKA